VRAIADNALRKVTCKAERIKSPPRPRVEHPFHVAKNLFGYCKALANNTNLLHLLFGLADLCALRRPLLS
jgi:IS5 family transposase